MARAARRRSSTEFGTLPGSRDLCQVLARFVQTCQKMLELILHQFCENVGKLWPDMTLQSVHFLHRHEVFRTRHDNE